MNVVLFIPAIKIPHNRFRVDALNGYNIISNKRKNGFEHPRPKPFGFFDYLTRSWHKKQAGESSFIKGCQ